MKRKMSMLLVVASMMFVLTGCRAYADYTVNGDDTVTIKSKMAYSESMMNSSDTSDMTLETLEDGNRYYVTKEEVETEPLSETRESGIYLSEDVFFYRLGVEGESVDSGGLMYMQLTIHLLSDIVDTNADVSVSGNTAAFSTDGGTLYWYAYTQKGKELIEADKEAPTMKGAKDGKYYKKMPTNIWFLDNIAVKDVILNGQYVRDSSSSSTSDGTTTKVTTWVNNQGKEVYKDGKNVFKVTDLSGNTATFTFYIDKKTPTVKGVKNNKTYKKKAVVYVKDNKQLSKITINGKKQKMTNKQLVKKGKYKGYYKYTVKKKGTHKIVVKDAAGNKKTVRIKIK